MEVKWDKNMRQYFESEKQLRRRREKTNKNIVYSAIFFIYLAVLLRITVFRSDFTIDHLWSGTINLSFFQSYLPLIQDHNWMRIVYLFGGNIVWFVPFGMYLWGTGKIIGSCKTALAGLAFSFAIEFFQYVFGTGVSELDDLILNTFGVWLGAVLAGFLKKEKKARKKQP